MSRGLGDVYKRQIMTTLWWIRSRIGPVSLSLFSLISSLLSFIIRNRSSFLNISPIGPLLSCLYQVRPDSQSNRTYSPICIRQTKIYNILTHRHVFVGNISDSHIMAIERKLHGIVFVAEKLRAKMCCRLVYDSFIYSLFFPCLPKSFYKPIWIVYDKQAVSLCFHNVYRVVEQNRL